MVGKIDKRGRHTQTRAGPAGVCLGQRSMGRDRLNGGCSLRVGRIEAGEAAAVARGTSKAEEQRWNAGRVDRLISSWVPTT